MKPFSKAIAVTHQYFNYLILDKRSLSLFRIVLGASILYNILFIKWHFVHAILGSNAFVPFELLDTISSGLDYSIFRISVFRSDLFLSGYMWLYLIATICFTIGIFPRIMAIGIVFFQFNLMQGANALITGVDYFNLHLIFWAVFLPLNEYFSILKSKTKQLPSLSICFVLLLQIGCIYLFSFLFKYGIPWKEGFAVRYMLMDTMNSWGLAGFFLKHKLIYEFITYATLFIEASVIVLLFIKWKWVKLRLLAAVLVFGFHTMILLSSDVSGFSFTGWAVAVLIIPSIFYSKINFPAIREVEVKRFSGWIKRGSVTLAIFASIVIVQRNFYALYRSYDDTITLNRLDSIMIPSIAKSSFYHQYWSMFAPNPPQHIGSFGIVEKVKDIDNRNIEATYVYNSTNKKVNDWESSLLYLFRQNIIELNDKPEGENIFSLWLKWKVEQLPNYSGSFENYILVETRILVDSEREVDTPKAETVYYYTSDIAKGNFKPFNKMSIK